jgi:hypothetical protein
MLFETAFMKLYEELSQLNEAKNKQKSHPQAPISAQLVQDILDQNQLIPISQWCGVNSISATGWTVLVPANKLSTFEKETQALDVLISRDLSTLAAGINIYGQPHKARGNILNNGKRSILEIDFGTYAQRNQWRGLGFTVSYKNYKYFILGYVFTKKRQKINADDSEVKSVNKLYDSVTSAFKNLEKA